MKQGWELIHLGDLCEFRNGLWKGKKPPYITAKVIRMTNFTKECEMNDLEPIELEVEEKQFLTRNLIDGDLLLEKSGGGPNQPVGRVVRFIAKSDENFSFSNFTTRIRIIDSENIESKYLHKYLKYFYLIGETEKFQNNSTNIRNLSLPAFKEISIPIPPHEEQKHIVAKLDECLEAIDKARANTEKNLNNAKELFQSQLNQIFSQKGDEYETKSFGDVCEIIGGSQPSKQMFVYEPQEGYVRLIQVRDYRTDKFMTYIPKDKTKKFCSKDDIMIGRYGPPIFGIFSGIDGAYNVALMKAVPDEKLLYKNYFRWFLKNKDLHKFVENSSARAAGQSGVRKELLYAYPVPIPTLDFQKDIVNQLDKLKVKTQSLESNYQQELNALDELKKSILQKAFEGQL